MGKPPGPCLFGVWPLGSGLASLCLQIQLRRDKEKWCPYGGINDQRLKASTEGSTALQAYINRIHHGSGSGRGGQGQQAGKPGEGDGAGAGGERDAALQGWGRWKLGEEIWGSPGGSSPPATAPPGGAAGLRAWGTGEEGPAQGTGGGTATAGGSCGRQNVFQAITVRMCSCVMSPHVQAWVCCYLQSVIPSCPTHQSPPGQLHRAITITPCWCLPPKDLKALCKQ